MALTVKEEAFVEQYLLLLNGAKAARMAGYAAEGARQKAWTLLQKPDIKAKIEERLSERAMGVNEALERITRLARADISDYLDDYGNISVSKVMEDGVSIAEFSQEKTSLGIKSRIKLHDSMAALEKLMKLHGLYNNAEVERLKAELGLLQLALKGIVQPEGGES